jgi:hypothetical protein|tara:strand:- start:1892 stop:2080 length:189 start_codon:yes stop_codon:yes gene_type:complete
METINKKWNDMSNSNIRIKLESLRHEHESIKTKIDVLIDNLRDIELDYLNGNEALIKRSKGE